MNLDDLLHDTLHDDRFALPVPADTLEGVRRRRRNRHRLAVAGTAVCALGLVGGAAVALAPGSSSTRLVPYAAGGGGVPEGSPAPGITPAFVPTSGRDWLLDAAQWEAYDKSHSHPSPAPGQSTVHSPAPLGPQSAGLLAEIQAAHLPAGTTYHRDDSTGGQPGAAAVEVTLPDGASVVVEETQMQEPFGYESADTSGHAAVFDIAGTSSAAVAFPAAPSVVVISRGGISTGWYTGSKSVTLADLTAWATAAEQAAEH